MRVFVKNLDDNICSIEIKQSESFETVRIKIEEKTGIDRDKQRLIHMGQYLDNWKKVSDYNIPEGSTINIIHRGLMERPSQSEKN
jgi:hypothetical protein